MLFLIKHIFSYEVLFCLTLILFCCGSSQKVDFKIAVDTTAKLIKLQMKLVYSLIDVSNNFNGVGLNTLEDEDENNTFHIVSCENHLINRSAHYLFNTWSNTPKEELKNNRSNNNRLNIENLTKQIIIN